MNRIAYGPFGEPQSWPTAGPRFRYTGQIALPAAQLYHYKARVYDPVLGRFLQTDPIGYSDDLNLYAYVANDPINGTDPSGMEWVFRDRSGKEEVTAEHEQALDYLKGSPTFNAEYSTVANSDKTYALQLTDEHTEFESLSRVLRWNPKQGAELPTGEIISPALLLGHDVSHAAEHARGPSEYDKGRVPTVDMVMGEFVVTPPDRTAEENRATSVERSIAQELGEPQRQRYRDGTSVITKGPTSRERGIR